MVKMGATAGLDYHPALEEPLGRSTMASSVVSSLLAAADWFLDIAHRDQVPARWSRPSALPGLTVGGVVGHVAAGVAWLVPLLAATPPDGGRVIGLGEYYLPLAIRDDADLEGQIHTAVRAQGERGAQRGPEEAVSRLATRVEEIRSLLPGTDPNRLLDLRPTLPGAIRLQDFLRTRVLELVVHGDDLATSVGLSSAPPEDAAGVTIEVLLATARRDHGDVQVIRALARAERCTARVVPVL